MGHSKTSKEGIWFCPTKAPPSFLVFLFLSLHLALLFYVPLMAIMLVMTTPPTCCHFAIACIGSSHQEEEGKWGGACSLLTLVGLWLHYHATTYNSCNSCCINVKENEEGGGVPFSSLLGVFFSSWCFRVVAAVAKRRKKKKKEKRRRGRRRRGKEEGRKEGRKEKKNKFGGWRWREPSSNPHCWELELSYKPMRLKHKRRLACLGEGSG